MARKGATIANPSSKRRGQWVLFVEPAGCIGKGKGQTGEEIQDDRQQPKEG